MREQLIDVGLVALAALLGGLVGLERTRRQKAAGLRTHMLVAGASALIILLGSAAAETVPGGNGDPARALHAVVTGIGFLGAGAILHGKRGDVTGLTTAASLFIAAAIGMAVAFEQILLAVGGTVVVLLTLSILGSVEKHIPVDGDEKHEEQDGERGKAATNGDEGEASAWKRLSSS
jgi:putative Mg2+ transporter-C (MgtC) family protein